MEHKSYYAIIPANVRYDNELTPNAKLLYGEITALCNEKGYCWANNSYFTELYGVSKVSISKWINSLIKQGYINSQIQYKPGTKEIKNRFLTIGQPIKEIFDTPITNINDPIKEKFNTPIKEKLIDNNTIINNTVNNTTNKYNALFEHWNHLSQKSKGLIKHRSLNPAIKKAIDVAYRQYKDVEKLKLFATRFVEIYDKKSNTDSPIKKRGMDDFYGQKAFQKAHLICSEYDDEGYQWRSRDDIKEKKVKTNFFGEVVNG